MRRLPSFKLLLLLSLIACAIAVDSGAQDPKPAALPEPKSLASIRALRSTIAAIASERDDKQDDLLKAATAAEKESIGTEIRDLNKKISKLKIELESVATGIEEGQLDEGFDDQIAFHDEAQEFFRPLLKEAKRATAQPRELEELRSSIAFHTQRSQIAERALGNLRSLIAATKNDDTKKVLLELEGDWTRRESEYENQLISAQYQLNERLEKDESLWDTLSGGIATFFRTKGKNLIIALASVGLTLFLLRLAHRGIARFGPFRRRSNTFAARLFDVIYFGFSSLLTICVGLAAFYALGDWMLLGFSLIILASLAWASKNTIPRVSEQIKLMLNLGPVREDERIVIGGVPWQVRKLRIYSRLTNPALEGGELRLPLRDLIPLSSRPFGPKEPFFPCEKGHWLLLADGTFGKVIRQTPECGPARHARQQRQDLHHRRLPRPDATKPVARIPDTTDFRHRLLPPGNRDGRGSETPRGENHGRSQPAHRDRIGRQCPSRIRQCRSLVPRHGSAGRLQRGSRIEIQSAQPCDPALLRRSLQRVRLDHPVHPDHDAPGRRSRSHQTGLAMRRSFHPPSRDARPPSQPPGMLVHVGRERVDSMRIHCLRYDDDVVEQSTTTSVEDCLKLVHEKAEGKRLWLRVIGLHEVDKIGELLTALGIHPLTQEDVLNTNHRPKIDDLGEQLYLTLKCLLPAAADAGGDAFDTEQLSLLLTDGLVVSFQESDSTIFDPLIYRLENGSGRLRRNGSDYLLWGLLDSVVDHYLLSIAAMEERTEAIDDILMSDPISIDIRSAHGLKAETLQMQRLIRPARELVGHLERGDSRLVSDSNRIYFRDLYDHALRCVEDIDVLRESINGLRDYYLSAASNRMNEVMKVLTCISTIFLPLTFLAGIYGMNFAWMPELAWKWGYPTLLGVFVFAAGVMFYLFRRNKWL